MLRMSYAGCPGLSSTISAHLAFKISVAAENRKNSLKPIFVNLRLFKVIHVNTNKNFVTIACYRKQHVCAYLQPFSRYRRLLR